MKFWIIFSILLYLNLLMYMHEFLREQAELHRKKYQIHHGTTFPDEVYKSGDFLKQKNYRAAEKLLRAALAKYPDCAAALSHMGSMEFGLGHPMLAIQYYTKAIESEKTYSDAFYNRAGVYWALKEYAKAANDYAEVVYMDPADDQALENEGFARLFSGDPIGGITTILKTDDMRLKNLPVWLLEPLHNGT